MTPDLPRLGMHCRQKGRPSCKAHSPALFLNYSCKEMDRDLLSTYFLHLFDTVKLFL